MNNALPVLLIGFDSAWTASRAGAIAGVFVDSAGHRHELGPPLVVDYREAEQVIRAWQAAGPKALTLVMLDQPTIVPNHTGTRPVERIVASAVCRRGGGMQPANRARSAMFGPDAPLWRFLERLGGRLNPLAPWIGTLVLETYPAVTLIALGWTLPDGRRGTRLPKYNPERPGTFSISDWRHVCSCTRQELGALGLPGLSGWTNTAAQLKSPKKADQDRLDACLCLLAAVHLFERRHALIVGKPDSGYILVPDSHELRRELWERCRTLGWPPSEWVRSIRPHTGARPVISASSARPAVG